MGVSEKQVINPARRVLDKIQIGVLTSQLMVRDVVYNVAQNTATRTGGLASLVAGGGGILIGEGVVKGDTFDEVTGIIFLGIACAANMRHFYSFDRALHRQSSTIELQNRTIADLKEMMPPPGSLVIEPESIPENGTLVLEITRDQNPTINRKPDA